MPVAIFDESQIEELLQRNGALIIEQIRAEYKNPFPEIMTIEQVCRYTQYSRPTIQKFIREKNFPVSRPCESQRFFKSAVDEWMKAQTGDKETDERLQTI